MIKGSGKKITMVEGDFGLTLPIKINGAEFGASDTIKMKIKAKKDGDALISKEYSNISESTIEFSLNESESNLLRPGTYYYTLDWYDGDAFLCNIIKDGIFKVEDKY